MMTLSCSSRCPPAHAVHISADGEDGTPGISDPCGNPVRAPTPGSSGGCLELHARYHSEDGMVHIDGHRWRYDSALTRHHDLVQEVIRPPNPVWLTARGGDGGRVGSERHGQQAYAEALFAGTDDTSSSQEQAGGGKTAARGHGADGGAGGQVHLTLASRDTDLASLLMLDASGGRGGAGMAGLPAGACRASGQLAIWVDGAVYDNRYRLLIRQPTIQPVDPTGILEFGRPVRVRDVQISNVGPMPTPLYQDLQARVTMHFDGPAPGVVRAAELHCLPRGMQDGQTATLPPFHGTLPSLPGPTRGDRAQISGRVEVNVVTQRFGNVLDEALSHTDMTITYPVELTSFTAAPTTPANTLTPIHWLLRNVAKCDMGVDTTTRRDIRVVVRSEGDEVFGGDVLFSSDCGSHPSVAPDALLSDQVRVLRAGESRAFKGAVGFAATVPSHSRTTLVCQLQLDGVVVQERIHSLQLAEQFVQGVDAGVVLVLGSNTPRAVEQAWRDVVHGLGCRMQVWNASYYGGFNFTGSMASMDMAAALTNKTVVVLGDVDPTQTALHLENAARAAATTATSTYVLPPHGLPEPTYDEPRIHETIKGFETAVRGSTAGCASVGGQDVIVMVGHSRCQAEHACAELQAAMACLFPERRFDITLGSNIAVEDRHAGLSPVFTLTIRRHADINALAGVIAAPSVASVDDIRSAANVERLCCALPFERKLQCLEAIADDDNNPVVQYLLDAILAEVQTEQAAARVHDGRGGLHGEALKQQLKRLVILGDFEFRAPTPHSPRWHVMVKMFGTLEAHLHRPGRIDKLLPGRRGSALQAVTRSCLDAVHRRWTQQGSWAGREFHRAVVQYVAPPVKSTSTHLTPPQWFGAAAPPAALQSSSSEASTL